MSNCIKDLYEYDLIKKCLRCGDISLKSNFHKDKSRQDGLQPYCICCRTQYYNENRDKIIEYKKKYYLDNHNQIIENHKNYNKQNRGKINEHIKNRMKSDLNFKLARNLRSTTSKAFKAQNVRKTNKTFDLLGCSHSFFKNWIIHQLYGMMTIENYGSVWQIDHCLPIASFNLLDENDMKKCFNWINLRPMYSSEDNSKNVKIDYQLYLMQEIKAYQFIKLNGQGGLN